MISDSTNCLYINTGCVRKLSVATWKALRCSGPGRLFHFGSNRRQFLTTNAQALVWHACRCPSTAATLRGKLRGTGSSHGRNALAPANVLPGDSLPGELLVQVSDTAVGTLVLGCLFSMLGAHPEARQKATADSAATVAGAASDNSTKLRGPCPPIQAGTGAAGSAPLGSGGAGGKGTRSRGNSSSSGCGGLPGRPMCDSQSAGAVAASCSAELFDAVDTDSDDGRSRLGDGCGERGDNAGDVGGRRNEDFGDGAGRGGHDGIGGGLDGGGGGGDNGDGGRDFGAGGQDDGRSAPGLGIVAGLCVALLGAAAALLARRAKLPVGRPCDLLFDHRQKPMLYVLQPLQQLQQAALHPSSLDGKEERASLQQQSQQGQGQMPRAAEDEREQPQQARHQHPDEVQPPEMGQHVVQLPLEQQPQRVGEQHREHPQQMRGPHPGQQPQKMREQEQEPQAQRVAAKQHEQRQKERPVAAEQQEHRHEERHERQQEQQQQLHPGAADGTTAPAPQPEGADGLAGRARLSDAATGTAAAAPEGAHLRICCRNFNGSVCARGHRVSVGKAATSTTAAAKTGRTYWPAFAPVELDGCGGLLAAAAQPQLPACGRTTRPTAALHASSRPEQGAWGPASTPYHDGGLCAAGDDRPRGASGGQHPQSPTAPARQTERNQPQMQLRSIRPGSRGYDAGSSNSSSSTDGGLERGAAAQPHVVRTGLVGPELPPGYGFEAGSELLLPAPGRPPSEQPQLQVPAMRPASRECGTGGGSTSTSTSSKGVGTNRSSSFAGSESERCEPAAALPAARRGLIVGRNAPSGLGTASLQQRRARSRLQAATTSSDAPLPPPLPPLALAAALAVEAVMPPQPVAPLPAPAPFLPDTAIAPAHHRSVLSSSSAAPVPVRASATTMVAPLRGIGTAAGAGYTASSPGRASYPSPCSSDRGSGTDMSLVNLCDEISALTAVQRGLEGAHRRADIWLATGVPVRASATAAAAMASS